jgi:hypothetical protein
MQSDQLEEIREKWRAAQEYNKENDKRFDSLERYAVSLPIYLSSILG